MKNIDFFPRKMENVYQKTNTDLRRLRGSIIVIEGLIGVGKSTLGKSLARYLDSRDIETKFFPEFVNRNFLELFLSDTKKYSFVFQIFMLEKRLEIYKEALEESKKGTVVIIDRSLIGDRTFAEMLHQDSMINDLEMEVYNSIISSGNNLEPSAVFFLNVSAEQAFERMKKRSNDEEVNGYSLEYFKKLEREYKCSINQAKDHFKIIEFDWSNEESIDADGILINEQILTNIVDQI